MEIMVLQNALLQDNFDVHLICLDIVTDRFEVATIKKILERKKKATQKEIS